MLVEQPHSATAPFEDQSRLVLTPGPFQPDPSHWVDYTVWLSDDLLLLVISIPLEGQCELVAVTAAGDRIDPFDVRYFSYANSSKPEFGPSVGSLVLVRFPPDGRAHMSFGRLILRVGATTWETNAPEHSAAVVDVLALVRRGLGGLDAVTRTRLMEFLSGAQLPGRDAARGLRLSKQLYMLREALRERLPTCVVAPDQPLGIGIDLIAAVDEQSFFIAGWLWDEEAQVTDLTAVSPEGTRAELLARAFRYPRPDIDQIYGVSPGIQPTPKPGFISFVELDAPSRLATGWVIELRDGAGTAVEIAGPAVLRDRTVVRNRILADMVCERSSEEHLKINHVHPALIRLQEREREGVEVETEERYGAPCRSPAVSIIVRLHQRIEFLEHQLAQFAHDPEFRQADLIYVVDARDLSKMAGGLASQLFQLYRVPFRLVTLRRDPGFAVSSNLAASLARSQLLLLLDGRVLPDRPGWLGKMVDFYQSTPGIGALGPKLLHEDDSLHHAGIHFSRLPGPSLWEKRHYFRGLHRNLPAASVPRLVLAVSGACLLVDFGLYQNLGGLRGIYVEGEYEDADLCLRLVDAGYQNWYLPDAELYYLEEEDRSRLDPMAQLIEQYNRWLYTHMWRDLIETATNGPTSQTEAQSPAATPGQR